MPAARPLWARRRPSPPGARPGSEDGERGGLRRARGAGLGLARGPREAARGRPRAGAPVTCPESPRWAAGSRRRGRPRPKEASCRPPGPGPRSPPPPPPPACPWRRARRRGEAAVAGGPAPRRPGRAPCRRDPPRAAQAAAAISCHLAPPRYPQGGARGGGGGGAGAGARRGGPTWARRAPGTPSRSPRAGAAGALCSRSRRPDWRRRGVNGTGSGKSGVETDLFPFPGKFRGEGSPGPLGVRGLALPERSGSLRRSKPPPPHSSVPRTKPTSPPSAGPPSVLLPPSELPPLVYIKGNISLLLL